MRTHFYPLRSLGCLTFKLRIEKNQTQRKLALSFSLTLPVWAQDFSAQGWQEKQLSSQLVFCLFVCWLVGSFLLLLFCFLRWGFIILELVLELALIGQACPELTEIHLPLPSECWD